MPIAEFCFCAPVTRAALDALLEVSDRGQGAYRDSHPWLVAQALWENLGSNASDPPPSQVAIVLACAEQGCEPMLSHFALIDTIDVVELHRGSWESRVRFGTLKPMHPVWQALDSVMLWPSAEQRQRESLEGLRQHRTALSVSTLHPYAICETPEFIRQL